MEYRVVERLARGGMGVVDLARDEHDELVALKRLVLTGSADEMQRARVRFEREREILATLDHPAIVPLIDVVDDSGELVLVMPYLSGGNLAQRVQEHGPLPPSEVKDIARRLLPALSAAHREGIVHRDLKPGNILFDERGRPFIADFGVALTQDSTPGLTMTGIVLGTPGFLSPEQARGEPTTSASDIASLGATLFFAATGTSPYGAGDPNAILIRTARGKPDIPRSLDSGLAKLIVPMLDGRADRRPTAAALAGGPAGTTQLPRLDSRRPPTAVVAGVAILVAIGMLALASAGSGGDESAAPSTAAAPPSTAGCTPQRYQPCGAAVPAPFTDGALCIDDHADYDEDPSNGCEAAPDRLDGATLVRELRATIVPASDVDRYRLEITDGGFDPLCTGRLRLTLTAPPNTALVLTLLDPDEDVIERVVATSSNPGTIDRRDPTCGRDDGGVYFATVEPEGVGRSADAYVLTRDGNF